MKEIMLVFGVLYFVTCECYVIINGVRFPKPQRNGWLHIPEVPRSNTQRRGWLHVPEVPRSNTQRRGWLHVPEVPRSNTQRHEWVNVPEVRRPNTQRRGWPHVPEARRPYSQRWDDSDDWFEDLLEVLEPVSCKPGTWGPICGEQCSFRCVKRACDRITGDCVYGCIGKRNPPKCST
ncbi:platelet endothelial aggregation receptor 1, partial [Biomphalaria glabrata]|uniref:Uncharacterized protein n=1 Tax=Biomphalaria glabrata TaxID=6526 RepID=A0A2C9L383_BIOGL